ncbi:maleylacetate reductase [Pollutimonas bauzanensis]|uniref:maleylacetate reductase n=1 Tax=Pollutimonas bauzanensis TaxID=658167 RepID=UPI0033405526
MKNFIYTSQAQRILFGPGNLKKLNEEAQALSIKKALVLCTKPQRGQADIAADLLGSCAAGVFDEARMHVPVETVAAAKIRCSELKIDGLVSIGGGSTVGLAKALARETGLPILAVPTTYAGSEMTPIYGITDNGLKQTGRDPRVLPRTVIYDPDLTLDLPVPISITSGLNAIAHAAEGLYAQDANPITNLMAQEGIRAIAHGLTLIHTDPHDNEGRKLALYGAWLCGTVLGNVGMALHHKLCHTLGGSFNLPHAETHTVILPHAMAYNAPVAEQAMTGIQAALGVQGTSAPAALFDLAQRLGAPTTLKALGMKEEDLDRVADIALANPYWNPRPIERQPLRQLLQDAYEGRRPS